MRIIAIVASAVFLSACTTVPLTTGGDAQVERRSSEVISSADMKAPQGAAENKDSARAHTNLGEAYSQVGRLQIALEEADEAIKRDPKFALAYHLRGQIYLKLNNGVEAGNNLNKARQLDPVDPNIANTFGWYECASGREQNGIAVLRGAVANQFYDTPARAYANLGLCYLRLQSDAQAEAAFIKAIGLDPNNREVLFRLADINYRNGKYAESGQYLQRFHSQVAGTVESLALGVRIARAQGLVAVEADTMRELKERFSNSEQLRALGGVR